MRLSLHGIALMCLSLFFSPLLLLFHHRGYSERTYLEIARWTNGTFQKEHNKLCMVFEIERDGKRLLYPF